jgi:hypothetical protein
MRDDQVRRYARHILLPDVGGLGQTALLVAAARLEVPEDDPDAALIAASYLAAGGVGTVVLRGATDAQTAALAVHGPDTRLVAAGTGGAPEEVLTREVVVPPEPAWWPAVERGSKALAFWRGGLAATRWMAGIANK